MIGGALALEVEHGVHDVLERLGTGDAATLGDVTDDEHRGAGLFREAHEPRCALAHLAHVAWRAFEVAREDRLDGIDDHHRGPHARGGGEDGLEIRLAEQRHVACLWRETIRAQLHLQRRLFTAHVERGVTGGLEPRRDLKENRRLADARLAADEHHRARHDAATEHEVELDDARGEPIRLGADDIAQTRRGGDRAAFAERPGPRHASRRADALRTRELRRDHLLNERVPFLAGGALPCPSQRFAAALGAAVD